MSAKNWHNINCLCTRKKTYARAKNKAAQISRSVNDALQCRTVANISNTEKKLEAVHLKFQRKYRLKR